MFTIMNEIKIPYFIYKNLIFVKKIDCDLKRKCKTITYVYEVYDDKGNMLNEVIHRNSLPAIIIYKNNKITELQYFTHGKKNREFGPAILKLNSKHEVIEESWYKDNKKVSKEEIEETKKMIDRRKKKIGRAHV
jgi:hypothetical protein